LEDTNLPQKQKRDLTAHSFIIFLEKAFQIFAFSLSLTTQDKHGTTYATALRKKKQNYPEPDNQPK